MKLKELKSNDMLLDRELTIENGIVESVSIDTERGLTAWLHVTFRGSGCGFGGFALSGYNRKPGDTRDYTAEWLTRCMTVAGVRRWEDVAGKPIRALHEGLGCQIVAIGHFLEDEWFAPSIEWRGDE